MSRSKTLKTKAWKLMSQYVRLKAATRDGYVKCVTCAAVKHYKEIHAGHYVHGKSKPTYFLEENVHPQCYYCNRTQSGNMQSYTIYMLDMYGRDFVDDLREAGKGVKKWGVKELREIVDEYKPLVDKLLKEKG